MKRYTAVALAFGLFLLLSSANAAPPASKTFPVKKTDTPAVKPLNLDKVNTADDEDDPYLSPDGYKLYYASNAAGSFDIMVATRSSLSAYWSAGKLVAELNTPDFDERSPHLTRDNKFYFASNRHPKDPRREFVKNLDIFFTRKLSAQSSFMMPAYVRGVCTEEEEAHPWVALNGREFYFSRKTKDGWCQFVASGPATGSIGDAKRIEELPAGFHHATLSSNGLIMYLQGPVENDRWGIFKTTRARAGARWEKPEPVTELNNPDGPRGDLSPSLSADGTKLYFASDRPGGKGGLDLYMIRLEMLKKPK